MRGAGSAGGRSQEAIAMDQVARDAARRLLDHLELDWVPTGDQIPPSDDPSLPSDPESRRRVIELLRAQLDTPDGSARQAESHIDQQPDAPESTEAQRHKLAYDYLVRLAHRFSGEEISALDTEEIRQFCERIRRSVEIMVDEFRSLLSGRRQFQEEFSLTTVAPAEGDVGATRIFRRGDIHGDLGKLLFNWRQDQAAESDERKLREAIEELKYHQMALLTGFRRSIKAGTVAVLDEISPESISEQGGGVLGAISGGNWKKYTKRYQELIDEDASWYQRRFMTAFREGYLDYVWRAKSNQPDQEQSHGGGEHD